MDIPMTMTNTSIARLIAIHAAFNTGLPGGTVTVSEQPADESTPFDGAEISLPDNDKKSVHVYLNDDDPDAPQWLINPVNYENTLNWVFPLTAENLQFCIEWLHADAWLLKSSADDAGFITTDHDAARINKSELRFPLGSTPRGTLLGWLDPTTGDIATDPENRIVEARFSKPLFCIIER